MSAPRLLAPAVSANFKLSFAGGASPGGEGSRHRLQASARGIHQLSCRRAPAVARTERARRGAAQAAGAAWRNSVRVDLPFLVLSAARGQARA